MAEQVPYRLLTIAGFILLFGFNLRRSYHGPLRLRILPTDAAWVMAALCLAGFAFAWWARLHLGRFICFVSACLSETSLILGCFETLSDCHFC